jgi:membrane glycosyltransferase
MVKLHWGDVMTKSIGYEIVAVLWSILAAMLASGFLFWVAVVMGGINIIAPMFQSYYESRG